MDRPDDIQGHPVRILKADGFRGQFPQNEEEIGYPDHDDGDGERLRRMLEERDRDGQQQGLERSDRSSAADGRRERTDDGHSDLNGCKKAMGIFLDRFDELDRLAAAPRAPADRFRFVPTLCPHCGWDMEGQKDSLVLICRNCDSAWPCPGP